MRRILLFQFSESGWRIAAAELELLEKHLSEGDEVMAVTCNGGCYGCDLNLKKQKLLCWNCRNQTKRGFGAMSQSVACKDYTEYISKEEKSLIQLMGQKGNLSQTKLRGLVYEDYDIGQAVLSILISRFRNPDIDPRKSAEITQNLLEAGMAAYLSADRVIGEYQPDLVYLFNGRGSQQRAQLRACEKHQVDYDVIEEGCDLNHYAVFRNATPHDIPYRSRKMLEAWDQGDRSKLSEMAKTFFEKRASGYQGYGIMRSFTQAQEKGRLPEKWDSNAHNVVIFCSSEDEFAAIGDQWKNKLYGSQLEGLKEISKSCRTHRGSMMIYLRMHPNLSHLMNEFRAECEALAHAQFRVILPESSISSYDLLRACDTVVSFASTIGIEAVYWEKPLVLLGSCFYQDLDVAYQAENHEEVMALLSREGLVPKDKTGALIYASYLVSFGEPYVMSQVGKTPTDVTFRGVHLRGGLITRKLLALRERFIGPTINRLIGEQDNTER